MDRPTPTGPAAPDLRVIEARVYRGGNIWSYEPAVHLVVDLGVLEGYPTDTLPGFTDRLLELAVGATLRTVDADEEVVIERLASRKNDPSSVSDADRTIYEKLKSRYEAPREGEADRLIPVDGDLKPGSAVDGILAALLEP